MGQIAEMDIETTAVQPQTSHSPTMNLTTYQKNYSIVQQLPIHHRMQLTVQFLQADHQG